MENLDIVVYDEDGRVIIEVDYNDVVYSEEYNKNDENIREAARTAVASLIDQIMEIDEEPLFRRKKIENQIFITLNDKDYLTREDILELIE
jgi:hypothetical protein